MKNKQFIFKYDKQMNLYSYVERNKKQTIYAYYNFNYKNNSLVRYDDINKLRVISQFESPCKLVHRFEAGESWVKVVHADENSMNLTYPKIKKQFALNNENQIVKFSIPTKLLEQWS